METKNIINVEDHKCRTFDPNELMYILRSNLPMFWSWGSRAFTVDNTKECRMLRFMVSGHLHKGHVYIFLNGLDLFDVILTTSRGRIIDRTPEEGIYNDQLVNWIDKKVESIPEYS